MGAFKPPVKAAGDTCYISDHTDIAIGPERRVARMPRPRAPSSTGSGHRGVRDDLRQRAAGLLLAVEPRGRDGRSAGAGIRLLARRVRSRRSGRPTRSCRAARRTSKTRPGAPRRPRSRAPRRPKKLRRRTAGRPRQLVRAAAIMSTRRPRVPGGAPPGVASKGGDRTCRRIRWHIVVFLAPAVLVYTAVMIFPLFNTLQPRALHRGRTARASSSASHNFRTLFGDPRWSDALLERARQQLLVLLHPHAGAEPDRHRCSPRSCPRTRGCASPRFYRSAIFIPTILCFVIVGFAWKLILSPIWGIAPGMLDAVGSRRRSSRRGSARRNTR